jgi:hypothetical protein
VWHSEGVLDEFQKETVVAVSGLGKTARIKNYRRIFMTENRNKRGYSDLTCSR